MVAQRKIPCRYRAGSLAGPGQGGPRQHSCQARHERFHLSNERRNSERLGQDSSTFPMAEQARAVSVRPRTHFDRLSGRRHRPDPRRSFPTRSQKYPPGYLRALPATIAAHGVPLSLHRNRRSIFQRNDPYWTLSEQLAGKQAPTQLGRAHEERGIEQICAYSPPGQGPTSNALGARARIVWTANLAWPRPPR